ncbi:hypothetical protein GLOIN_2v1471016 [Rhizophagus irregularis DAOM 181602=DAOM 197198]|nr:hypothetical protein GLOIN_2v1471016 [Rhizophagus irregularis DAOM 181602=DAOM 197198]
MRLDSSKEKESGKLPVAKYDINRYLFLNKMVVKRNTLLKKNNSKLELEENQNFHILATFWFFGHRILTAWTYRISVRKWPWFFHIFRQVWMRRIGNQL